MSTPIEKRRCEICGDATLITDGQKIAYSEEEAAELLLLKPRTLADYRRQGALKGNFSRVGRNVLYTPLQLRGILALFSPKKVA